jgi:hypothetical protein
VNKLKPPTLVGTLIWILIQDEEKELFFGQRIGAHNRRHSTEGADPTVLADGCEVELRDFEAAPLLVGSTGWSRFGNLESALGANPDS